jgi:hypothetical protein
VLQIKPGVSNFVTSAYISSKKMIDIYFYCWGYENYKGLAIIQDFAAYWAIKNKEMANVLRFGSGYKIITFKIKDVLISFEHWIKLGNFCSCFLKNLI